MNDFHVTHVHKHGPYHIDVNQATQTARLYDRETLAFRAFVWRDASGSLKHRREVGVGALPLAFIASALERRRQTCVISQERRKTLSQ